jgi:hypothetical protein
VGCTGRRGARALASGGIPSCKARERPRGRCHAPQGLRASSCWPPGRTGRATVSGRPNTARCGRGGSQHASARQARDPQLPCRNRHTDRGLVSRREVADPSSRRGARAICVPTRNVKTADRCGLFHAIHDRRRISLRHFSHAARGDHGCEGCQPWVTHPSADSVGRWVGRCWQSHQLPPGHSSCLCSLQAMQTMTRLFPSPRRVEVPVLGRSLFGNPDQARGSPASRPRRWPS